MRSVQFAVPVYEDEQEYEDYDVEYRGEEQMAPEDDAYDSSLYSSHGSCINDPWYADAVADTSYSLFEDEPAISAWYTHPYNPRVYRNARCLAMYT